MPIWAARFQMLTTRALSEEIRIWKRKLFPKTHVFPISFLRKLDKKIFSRSPNTTCTLRKRWGFLGDTQLKQGAKTIGKNALYIKSTLARTPIYDRAYPEKFSTVSFGNPEGVTKHSWLLMFLQNFESVDKGYGT